MCPSWHLGGEALESGTVVQCKRGHSVTGGHGLRGGSAYLPQSTCGPTCVSDVFRWPRALSHRRSSMAPQRRVPVQASCRSLADAGFGLCRRSRCHWVVPFARVGGWEGSLDVAHDRKRRLALNRVARLSSAIGLLPCGLCWMWPLSLEDMWPLSPLNLLQRQST